MFFYCFVFSFIMNKDDFWIGWPKLNHQDFRIIRDIYSDIGVCFSFLTPMPWMIL